MNLRIFSFSIFLFFSQIWYFNSVLSFIFLFFGFLTFAIAVVSKKINMIFSGTSLLLFCLYLTFFGLCFLLMFLGDYQENTRILFIYSLIQLVMFFCIKDVKDHDMYFLRKIFILYFFIEVLILLSQFIYVSYGFGVQPKNDFGILAIGGTHGNPNNLAVVLSLIFIFISITKSKYSNNSNSVFYLIIIFYIFGVFLISSRTVVIFSIAFLILFFGKKGKKYLFSIISAAAIFYLYNYSSDNQLLSRSIDKITSINTLDKSDSADFRVLAFRRLFENFFDLGLGTWSDRNYIRFFDDNDPELIKYNPHGFLPEISFLFGLFGFFLGVAIIYSNIYILYNNRSFNLVLKILLITIILFYMSVPSSILSMPIFFILVYLISKSEILYDKKSL